MTRRGILGIDRAGIEAKPWAKHTVRGGGTRQAAEQRRSHPNQLPPTQARVSRPVAFHSPGALQRPPYYKQPSQFKNTAGTATRGLLKHPKSRPCWCRPPAMARSRFASQAFALAAKSKHYQGRKRCQNCCLVLLPLIFMSLLAILQIFINAAIAKAGLACGEPSPAPTALCRLRCGCAEHGSGETQQHPHVLPRRPLQPWQRWSTPAAPAIARPSARRTSRRC